MQLQSHSGAALHGSQKDSPIILDHGADGVGERRWVFILLSACQLRWLQDAATHSGDTLQKVQEVLLSTDWWRAQPVYHIRFGVFADLHPEEERIHGARFILRATATAVPMIPRAAVHHYPVVVVFGAPVARGA